MGRKRSKTPKGLTLQCPCCDYFTFAEWAAHEVCAVCFWENDGLDLNQITVQSPSNNSLTLWQARTNFETNGACHEDFLAKVCPDEQRKDYEYQSRRGEGALIQFLLVLEASGALLGKEDSYCSQCVSVQTTATYSEAEKLGASWFVFHSPIESFYSAEKDSVSACEERLLEIASAAGVVLGIGRTRPAVGVRGWLRTDLDVGPVPPQKRRSKRHVD